MNYVKVDKHDKIRYDREKREHKFVIMNRNKGEYVWPRKIR